MPLALEERTQGELRLVQVAPLAGRPVQARKQRDRLALVAQGGPQGPRLGPNPIPQPRFVAYVRNPSGDMPPFTAKVISDDDLAKIYAFLQSRPAPPPVKDIPLLAP